jgi:hypothetical protein
VTAGDEVYDQTWRRGENAIPCLVAPMTLHVNADYVPPKTWQQFEELCADIYAADWSDPAVQRYGRGGQSQHGVDIGGFSRPKFLEDLVRSGSIICDRNGKNDDGEC